MNEIAEPPGGILRRWRQRRRFSQLDLASEAAVSTRHLSFIESGRASPSREMLLKLADCLLLPPRERNRLLLAGGFAPIHRERPLDAPDMRAARAALDGVLAGHEPFPALAVDRHWNLVAANGGVRRLLDGIDPALLTPPVNVLRLSLHPDGLAPRIENLAEWRHHLLVRLGQEANASGDPALLALLAELKALPGRAGSRPYGSPNGVAVKLHIRDPRSATGLSFLSTTTIFGTATDITLSELTLECFFPADVRTREILTREILMKPAGVP